MSSSLLSYPHQRRQQATIISWLELLGRLSRPRSPPLIEARSMLHSSSNDMSSKASSNRFINNTCFGRGAYTSLSIFVARCFLFPCASFPISFVTLFASARLKQCIQIIVLFESSVCDKAKRREEQDGRTDSVLSLTTYKVPRSNSGFEPVIRGLTVTSCSLTAILDTKYGPSYVTVLDL